MIAHLLFSVPAVKGVEFGSGFAGARMRGSENNDPFLDVEGTTATNNAGGINGGLTNGNELVVRAAVKPTPSIGREQMTYNLATNKVEPLMIRGRHDICVACGARWSSKPPWQSRWPTSSADDHAPRHTRPHFGTSRAPLRGA